LLGEGLEANESFCSHGFGKSSLEYAIGGGLTGFLDTTAGSLDLGARLAVNMHFGLAESLFTCRTGHFSIGPYGKPKKENI